MIRGVSCHARLGSLCLLPELRKQLVRPLGVYDVPAHAPDVDEEEERAGKHGRPGDEPCPAELRRVGQNDREDVFLSGKFSGSADLRV